VDLLWGFLCVKVVFACLFLGYASWSDWRSGVVVNRLWVLCFPVGLGLSLVECIVFGGVFVWWLIGVLVSVGFGLSLFFVRFGGADCKALMTLGVLFPLFPLSNILGFVFVVLMFAGFCVVPGFLFDLYKSGVVFDRVRFVPFLFLGFLVALVLWLFVPGLFWFGGGVLFG
jgi:Flp pilus assembly protein protease CpaA